MSILMVETSESRRVLADRCWEAFWHKYIEELIERATPEAERGKAAHGALYFLVKEMLDSKKLIKSTGREVKPMVEKACREHLTAIIQPKGVIDHLSPMVRYGLLGFDPADYDVIEPEKEFDIVIDSDGHRLRGKMDLFLVRKDGVVVIVDYKTGVVYEAEGDIQLATYALVARYLGFAADQIQVCFKFLASKTIKLTFFSDDYLDYVLDLHRAHCAEREKRLAVGRDAFPARPSWFCEWCGFKGVCSKQSESLGLLPSSYRLLSPEAMKDLARWVLVAEPLVSEAKALLKQNAEFEGYIEANGEYFGMFSSISREFDAEKVFFLLSGQAIFDMSVFKVDILMLERKFKQAPFWGELEKLATERVRRNFGHKNQPPQLPETMETENNEECDVA